MAKRAKNGMGSIRIYAAYTTDAGAEGARKMDAFLGDLG